MRAATARFETYAAYATPAHNPAVARNVRNIALLAAAPFIGLAFVVGFPVIGLAALAWLAWRALREHHARVARAARNVLLFAAAPFVGLAYALAFPFVGLGALAWMAVRAARERAAA